MEPVRNMWNRWKKRAQTRTQATQLDCASNSSMNLRPSNFREEFKSSRRIISINPTLNDDDVTVGKVSQPSYGMKKYHSFQLPTNSEPRMVQAHQTSTLDSKDLDTSEKVEDPQSNRPKILCAPSSVNSRQQPSPVSYPIPHDGVSTRQLLMKLLKTGSEKLSFTLQAMELLREYVWILEMFPNHIHLGEELQVDRWVTRRMTPPPQPRINVFAQPALLALIKTDVQGNWLINRDTLGCLLYFLYRQECIPMLDEPDQEREELERMRQARQEHVEQLKISDKFGSMSLK